jgi:hypothetical protein
MIALFLLAGCAQLLPPGWNATPNQTPQTPTAAVTTEVEQAAEDVAVIEETEEIDEALEEEAAEEPVEAPANEIAAPETPAEAAAPEQPSAADSLPRKIVTEGDVVGFPNLQATDPDGDPIAYTFTPPLDSAGKWQTKVGDAGEYRVTITASDGKNSVSQVVIVQVNPKNQPPRIQLASKEVRVKEGETVTLNVKATDPDGDKVALSFDGWMTGPARATTFDDAGVHDVQIIASDGKSTARDTIRVVVENTNRAPSISPIADIIIKEGDRITVQPTASDPDGDNVSFIFQQPIRPDGTWQTTKDNVGKYRINVTVTDGSLAASTSFLMVVESLNNPPVIQLADLVTVDEGMTVTLTPTITDPEGDELTITYSGWMNANSYATTYEDAGSHLVTITVSDGINTVKKDLTVMVNDVNRPPSFGSGAFS